MSLESMTEEKTINNNILTKGKIRLIEELAEECRYLIGKLDQAIVDYESKDGPCMKMKLNDSTIVISAALKDQNLLCDTEDLERDSELVYTLSSNGGSFFQLHGGIQDALDHVANWYLENKKGE